jgi:hypothetical protein
MPSSVLFMRRWTVSLMIPPNWRGLAKLDCRNFCGWLLAKTANTAF